MPMKQYQREFLELAISENVISFGEFTLKSGRVSPYFFNAGLFSGGRALAHLGRLYAAAIADADPAFDMLFGPAYKGIPLAASTAIALAEHHRRDVAFSFNRKEAKDHGEGGRLIGAPLAGRVLIVDDVITAGTAIGESVEIIRAAGATPAAVVIALDRQERAAGTESAVDAARSRFGLDVISIAGLNELLDFLHEHREYHDHFERIQAYRAQFGVS